MRVTHSSTHTVHTVKSAITPLMIRSIAPSTAANMANMLSPNEASGFSSSNCSNKLSMVLSGPPVATQYVTKAILPAIRRTPRNPKRFERRRSPGEIPIGAVAASSSKVTSRHRRPIARSAAFVVAAVASP